VLGLATPFAAAALIGTMLTAIHRVHLKNGPWNANQGYEYNLVLICAAVLLAEVGPGPLSLDHVMGVEKTGLGWGLGALAMGGAGAFAVSQLSQSAPSESAPQQARAATPAAQPPKETPESRQPVAAR
jgi:putative oxidoreductase